MTLVIDVFFVCVEIETSEEKHVILSTSWKLIPTLTYVLSQFYKNKKISNLSTFSLVMMRKNDLTKS
jgi:hypothetical protein